MTAGTTDNSPPLCSLQLLQPVAPILRIGSISQTTAARCVHYTSKQGGELINPEV
jgi:hypothetical protein